MRVNFSSYFSENLKDIRNIIRKNQDIDKYIGTVLHNGREYDINKVSLIICATEVIFSFISFCLNKQHVSMNDLLRFFRTTSNSDVPYFNRFDKSKVAKLHNLLFHWEYKSSVEQALTEYIKYPDAWKIMQFVNNVEGEKYFQFKANAISNERYNNYIKSLDKPIEHLSKSNNFDNLKTENIFKSPLYYLDKMNSANEKCITIPEEIMEYARKTWSPIILDTSQRKHEKITIKMNDLVDWAEEMDSNDKLFGLDNNWKSRIEGLVFSVPNRHSLDDRNILEVYGTHHIVGALSVGKSTFINVCSYGIVKAKKRVAVILNTTTDVLKFVDYMNKQGIKAVPLLSNNQISRHSNQYLSSIKSHHELFSQHASFKYVNNSCVLLNQEKSIEDALSEDFEPCNALYVYENDNKKIQTVCPFICVCPRFNNIRDISDAEIIVSTMNSAVQSSLPTPFTKQNMRLLEYIIRTCDIAFIDESDQVQASLDSMFCSEIDIYGGSDVFYQPIRTKMFSYQGEGTVPNDENIFDFMKAIYAVEYYATNIASYLNSNQNMLNVSGGKGIFDHLIKSQLLWRDLFGVAIGISHENFEKSFKNDIDFSDQFYRARKAFGNVFEKFQMGFLNGEVPLPNDQIYYGLRSIASNIMDETKLFSDLNNFSNIPLSQLLRYDNGEQPSKEEFNKLEGLCKNWDKTLYELMGDGITEKLRFIMELYMLEHKLRFVLQKWSIVSKVDSELVGGKQSYVGALKHEFAGLIPVLPIDMNYGFLINRDKTNRRINIKYINFEGIGRWILLNIDKLYRDIDGSQINCVLLSGTSNMITSPKYNIDLPISCLLRKSDSHKPKLNMYFPNTVASKVSGANKKMDNQHLNIVADNLLSSELSPNGISYLNNVFERMPDERKRILFALGSYDSCSTFTDRLNKNIGGMEYYSLVRSGEKRGDNYREIERSKIEDIAKYRIDGLSIPLSSGRGYNIITTITEIDDFLESENQSNTVTKSKSVAAMGAVFFVQRPYYIPNDINILISWLNSEYVKTTNRYKMGSYSDIEEYRESLLSHLHTTMYEFDNMFGYFGLSKSQRDRLLGDTLVDVYQLACRLIRGNVDAEIHFVDSSFAPNTSQVDGAYDDERTSMLIGWRKMLHNMINQSSELSQNQINTELYQILVDGLIMIKLNEKGVESYDC